MGYAEQHNIKALCFDIDGTFYPQRETHEYLFKSFIKHPIFSVRYNNMRQRMRKEDGLELSPVMTLSAFRDKECSLIYGRPLPSYSERYNRDLFSSWQKTSRLIRPYKNVRESLEEAKRRGYILAVLSDFPIGNKLETLHLEGLFDYVASAEDCGYLKPNATPFCVMLDKLNVKPAEALYVGDSERKDIHGAANVGMHTLLINASKKKAASSSASLVLTGWDKFINMVL